MPYVVIESCTFEKKKLEMTHSIATKNVLCIVCWFGYVIFEILFRHIFYSTFVSFLCAQYGRKDFNFFFSFPRLLYQHVIWQAGLRNEQKRMII